MESEKKEKVRYYRCGTTPRAYKNVAMGYRWYIGYSLKENGDCLPWITRKEATLEAKKAGVIAIFVDFN